MLNVKYMYILFVYYNNRGRIISNDRNTGTHTDIVIIITFHT